MWTGDDSGAAEERAGASAGGGEQQVRRVQWKWGECGVAGEENAFPERRDDDG